MKITHYKSIIKTMSTTGFTKAQVKKSATLAHISKQPSNDFLEKYESEIAKILEYMKELDEVDTANINPLDGLRTNTIKDLREDTINTDQEKYKRVRLNIIAGFPNKQGDLLEIPGIFE